MDLCEAQLDSYDVTTTSDEELKLEKKGEISERLWMAIKVRRCHFDI